MGWVGTGWDMLKAAVGCSKAGSHDGDLGAEAEQGHTIADHPSVSS